MDPSFLPAWRLAEMTRAGEIGCLELLDHFWARVERLDGRINAVVLRDIERARQRARQLDAGGRANAGNLFGVPMTVKESFDLAGHPSTWGFPERKDHRADVDALAVQRLEAAGAVVFGKTNVPVALADWQSYNPVYGTTSNPWNTAHTPGGSSGGGAAACAAGFGGLELGSDIGGSIRVPAHYCGLFGHKPTWGLCPPRGHSPANGAAPPDIAVIGPLARSARDLQIALDAIVGPDPAETALALTLPPPRTTEAGGLRVAVWSHEPGQTTDSEQVALIESVGKHLAAAGAEVSLTARPEFNVTEAYRLYLTLLDAALSARIPPPILERKREAKAGLRPEDMSASAIMLRAVDMPHSDWLRANERRHQIRRAWSAFFQRWDVLLCPVVATPALPHMQHGEVWERSITVDGRIVPYEDMLFWPGITCAYHLPASVAPIGLSRAGLPIGVQIVGPLYGDRTTIAVADLLERDWRGFVPPPGCA
jgi:amidase